MKIENVIKRSDDDRDHGLLTFEIFKMGAVCPRQADEAGEESGPPWAPARHLAGLLFGSAKSRLDFSGPRIKVFPLSLWVGAFGLVFKLKGKIISKALAVFPQRFPSYVTLLPHEVAVWSQVPAVLVTKTYFMAKVLGRFAKFRTLGYSVEVLYVFGER